MTTPLDINSAESVSDVLKAAAAHLRTSPRRSGCAVHLPAQGRLLASGDLHDNQEHLRRIVSWAKLDESLDHHVVLQELIHGDRLINGMDFSYRMLVRVAELVLQFPDQVHPILANHEMSQLTGAGVSKGAGNSVELFDHALDYVFGDAWEEVNEAIREFIRAMPLAVIGGPAADHHAAQDQKSAPSAVFCAHSLPDEVAMRWFDVDILGRELREDDFRGPTGSAYSMVWGRRYSDAQMKLLAERWGVTLFCLGHKHVEDGVAVIGERVLVLNSDHEHGMVVPIDLASVPSAREAAKAAIPLATAAPD